MPAWKNHKVFFFLFRGCKKDSFNLIWTHGISNIVGNLVPNPFYTYKQFYFKQFSSASVQFFFVYTQLNVKTVLFQTIDFSISTQFNSIRPIDRTLSGANNPGQSEPGSDGNKEVLHIPQSSIITGVIPSDCFVSYPEYLLGEVLPLCTDVVDVFCNASRLDYFEFETHYLLI